MKLCTKLDDEFHFNLDPCTTPDNPLQTQVGFTKDDDGLKQRWDFGGSVFVNPLYGKTSTNGLQKHGRKAIPYVISPPEKRPLVGPAEIVIGYKK